LGEVATIFLRLGAIGFGGPAAHIALMRRELIERRHWEDEQTYLDLIGVTSLLPGPNSTELAIELGRRRAGIPGLVVAGVAFILPAALIVTFIAWCYERYEQTTIVTDLRRGIVPVVVAIIAHAVWKLGRTAVRGPVTLGIALAAAVGFLAGVHDVLILVGGALLTLLWSRLRGVAAMIWMLPGLLAAPPRTAADASGTLDLPALFWSFLRIGATLFGSGYVLVAMLDSEFVERLGVLTDTQLLDAISIGQVTPGPVFTTATFVGYLLAGLPGAVVASIAIFLPAFLLVLALGGFLERWLRRPSVRVLLDGLNAAALGLIAAAAVRLAGSGIDGPLEVALAVIALVLLFVGDVNPMWLVLGGVAVGLVLLAVA
jgi:chromate transporter